MEDPNSFAWKVSRLDHQYSLAAHLAGMDKPNARCDELIETTMRALDPATVMLMLLAVQTENLELNVKSLVPW